MESNRTMRNFDFQFIIEMEEGYEENFSLLHRRSDCYGEY